MATYPAAGVVLKRTNLGEADRIVTFYTREHGLVRAVARGVRRIKSKMAGHLEPFSVVDLMLAEGKSLDVITSARLTRSHEELLQNYDLLPHVFLLGEMIDRLSAEGEPNAQVYDLLLASLSALDNGTDPTLTEVGFKLQLLESLGHHPELSACVVCQGRNSNESYHFSPSLGGITDEGCRDLDSLPMSQRAIKVWRLLQNNPLQQVAEVTGADIAAKEALGVCDIFYEYTFGRRYRPRPLI